MHDPDSLPTDETDATSGAAMLVAESNLSAVATASAAPTSPPRPNSPRPADQDGVTPGEVADYLSPGIDFGRDLPALESSNGSGSSTPTSTPSSDADSVQPLKPPVLPSDSTRPRAVSTPAIPFPKEKYDDDASESDELGDLPRVSSGWSSPPSSNDHATSPISPSSPHVDSPLIPSLTNSRGSFISSPLNPNAPPVPRSQPVSRRGSTTASRILSEESAAFAGSQRRGSMLLYRIASEEDKMLMAIPTLNRFPAPSRSDSMSFDTKYPSEKPRGLVPYVYDPEMANEGPPDEVDKLHDIDELPGSKISKRGVGNIGLIILLTIAYLCLFVLYPTYDSIMHSAERLAQSQNIHINGTGQSAVLPLLPSLVDSDTPDEAKTRLGFDGNSYSLVFSDEFNKDGRTFFPGDDPYWEAVDLWYGATADLEWYDPQNAFTRDGHLVLLMENVVNHGLNYRSAMVQSWNKFCFTNGYIEVSLSLPGPNEDTAGYWPGVWTMGNLGRPGYMASTDGMWPYSYDSCDVGTFPNQTYANGTGPAQAIDSASGWAQYDNRLSWLSGQRASACTCKGEDHPGPLFDKGRGAPEIDVLEAQKNQVTGVGGKVSQSVQFAPFTHDYLYDTGTGAYEIFNEDITQPNGYMGSAVQQAISGLTDLPSDIFNGTGGNFYTFGFEYWADPNNRDESYIAWQANGVQSVKVQPGAVGPDPLPGGSGVGQRLIPEEPLSIVLNLGMSEGFQTIDLSTMTFPAEFHIDYVRVYQRDDDQNIGCDPKNYPTASYIEDHIEAYTNANLTTWEAAGFTRPRNSGYDGC